MFGDCARKWSNCSVWVKHQSSRTLSSSPKFAGGKVDSNVAWTVRRQGSSRGGRAPFGYPKNRGLLALTRWLIEGHEACRT
jgi:hypothetical protein